MENKLYFKLRYRRITSTITCELIDFEQDIFQLSLKSDLDTLRRAENLKSLCEEYSIIINSKGEAIIMSNSRSLKKDTKNLSKFSFNINSFK